MNELTEQNTPFGGLLPPLQGYRVSPIQQQANQQAPANTPVYKASSNVSEKRNQVDADGVINEEFTYDGYQVVRGEYFSHINEPSVTFSENRFSVNAACLKRCSDVEFVQVLVHQGEHKLVVRPCTEDVKDSFAWCTVSRKPKKVICPLFFGKIMSMMGWHPEHRYKIIGKMVRSQGMVLFVFDLKSPEIYLRSMQIDENGNEKTKIARKPTYLDSWKDHFGLPVEEHQKALQINIFDGYALIGVKETKHTASENKEVETHERDKTDPLHTGGLPQTAIPNQ